MKQHVRLSVPDRRKPADGAFDTRPASVKRWIESLPIANVGEATRQLYSALTGMNRQDIPAPQRFKALELISPSVLYVSDELKKHFVGRPLPLSEKTCKIARLARELTRELATGYKILVIEQLAGSTLRKDKKMLVTCIHRALRLLSSVLLKSYQVYAAYPDRVWLEIHTLYHCAEERRLHNTRVLEENAKVSRTSTIADAYKQILLLALACPYRLRHGEVEKVYQALEQWAPHTRLRPFEDTADALFVTNLDSDQPPTYLVLRDTDGNTQSCRTLDTSQLGEDVRRALAELRRPGASAWPLSANTLRRLMLAWGVLPKRRFSRTRDHAQVVVAMGLSSIHYFVSGEVVFNNASIGIDCRQELAHRHTEPVFDSDTHFTARETRDRGNQIPELWEMDYRLEDEKAPSPTEVAVARAAAGMRIDPSHRTQTWKMVNVSAGGYCLLWDNPEATRAQVGELIGLREQSDPDTFHWRLGVIRWLKYVEKRGLELGVQMLSPGAVAIAARASNRKGGKGEYTRGLLLPEIASIQQQATLLLPSPPFRAGDTAIANCHGKEIRVKLTKLVENTGSFAQFQFAPLGEVNKAARTETAPKPRDFDDIWEIL